MTDQPREFPDRPQAADLGDPALDPPMTVRVERWEDRMRDDVRRAVRTSADLPPWIVVAAPESDSLITFNVGDYLSHYDVRTWPVCPAVVNEAAYPPRRRTGPA
ncbi:MAG TPA: hypothetical protein VIL55_11710 [Naasia sp.]|jgi:hypothetical protein